MGNCKASVSLAVDEYVSEEKHTSWIPVEAWGKTAEIIGNYVTKGKQIGVQGSLKADSFQDKEGNNRKRLYVRIERIELLGRKEEDPDSTPGDEVEF